MNTKSYLTTFLIFIPVFLFCFSSNAQNSSDTIRIARKGLGTVYYHDTKELTFKQAKALTKDNQAAYRLMQKADTMRVASYALGIVGGVALGFSLGHAIGRVMVGNTINKPLFFSMLGAGVVFIGISIGCEVGANNNAKEAVAIFNNAIKQSNNANLDLGFSPGGVMLRLNF